MNRSFARGPIGGRTLRNLGNAISVGRRRYAYFKIERARTDGDEAAVSIPPPAMPAAPAPPRPSYEAAYSIAG